MPYMEHMRGLKQGMNQRVFIRMLAEVHRCSALAFVPRGPSSWFRSRESFHGAFYDDFMEPKWPILGLQLLRLGRKHDHATVP